MDDTQAKNDVFKIYASQTKLVVPKQFAPQKKLKKRTDESDGPQEADDKKSRAMMLPFPYPEGCMLSDYKLVKKLGKGGFATVFLVEDAKKNQFALKVGQHDCLNGLSGQRW